MLPIIEQMIVMSVDSEQEKAKPQIEVLLSRSTARHLAEEYKVAALLQRGFIRLPAYHCCRSCRYDSNKSSGRPTHPPPGTHLGS